MFRYPFVPERRIESVPFARTHAKFHTWRRDLNESEILGCSLHGACCKHLGRLVCRQQDRFGNGPATRTRLAAVCSRLGDAGACHTCNQAVLANTLARRAIGYYHRDCWICDIHLDTVPWNEAFHGTDGRHDHIGNASIHVTLTFWIGAACILVGVLLVVKE